MSLSQYLKHLHVNLKDENKCAKCNREAQHLDCFFPFEVTGNRCTICHGNERKLEGKNK